MLYMNSAVSDLPFISRYLGQNSHLLLQSIDPFHNIVATLKINA